LSVTPIKVKSSIIRLVFLGDPLSQKNDLFIYKKKVRKKNGMLATVPFIGHSKKLEDVRSSMSVSFYKQYIRQGYKHPIDYDVEVDCKFYCRKRRGRKLDLDNLPALPLDALQGFKDKKTKLKLAVTLKDDGLVRRIIEEDFLEGEDRYNGQARTEITIRRYR